MPNRLIREEMLESESILSLPIEARWFYVTILLSADDVGLFEATSFKLARRADINRDIGEKLLCMLADNDLVRLYEVNGKRYGFIPRFRQRIQIRKLKHPLPSAALMADDEDAVNKIKHLASNPTVGQQLSTDGQQGVTAAQPSEAEAEAEAEVSLEGTNVPSRPSEAGPVVQDKQIPACDHKAVISLYHTHCPTLPRVEVWNDTRSGFLRQRWREVALDVAKTQTLTKDVLIDWWRDFFKFVALSEFLTGKVNSGKNQRSFVADLEWLIRPGNFAKVIENRYHRK